MWHKFRILLAVLSVSGLVGVFLFQQQDVAMALGFEDSFLQFIINRSIRFLLNDTLAIILIYSLFNERKYVMFAIWVQVMGMVFVLIPYFILKFNYPDYNGPLLSFLHRLVLNPTIVLLLIPAFYYQRNLKK